MSYYQEQVDKVLNFPNPYGERIQVKFTVSSEDGEDRAQTNWLSLTREEVSAIKSLLTRE